MYGILYFRYILQLGCVLYFIFQIHINARMCPVHLVYFMVSDRTVVVRMFNKLLYLASFGRTGTLQNGLFLMFWCKLHRCSGKHPMKWPVLDSQIPPTWLFLKISTSNWYIGHFPFTTTLNHLTYG